MFKHSNANILACLSHRAMFSGASLNMSVMGPAPLFSVGMWSRESCWPPFCGPTRTEEDFLAHIQTVVATDPKVARWHIVCDNLNIHQSEALVRRVADISDIQQNLGKKGEYGILALMPRRAAFLSDPTHKVVFHYTPNHSSWLNQIEIWLSILMRKVLKRGSFTSLQDLETKVFAFIDDYNATMAKPLKWTSQGKALTM